MITNTSDYASLTDDQVLFFIRIRGKKSYFSGTYTESLLNRFERLREFRTISEYKKDADVYIDLNKFDCYHISPREQKLIHDVLPVFEIIQRCRGLRSIGCTEAMSLIVRCARFFIELFETRNLKLIVTGCVDNYVMDIMVRFASYYEVATLGVTGFFLSPKYKLVTVTGEHNMYREPEDEEVREMHRNINTLMKSAMAISRSAAIRQTVYDYLSFHYRWFFRYIINHKILGSDAYEHRFAPFLKKFSSIFQLHSLKYFSSFEKVLEHELSNAIYMPLHYVPEATIDYWVKDPNDVNYLASICKVARNLSDRGYLLVVKEHPAFYLARSSFFYKTLLDIPNVILLEPFTATRTVFDHIKKVVVWTGSTGVEALAAGLEVKIVSENYYSNGRIPLYSEDRTFSLDEGGQLELVRWVLQTSLKI
jgi:hypothetical protein